MVWLRNKRFIKVFSLIISLILLIAYDFEEVKREVQELLEGNLIVGQSLGYDFCVSYFFFSYKINFLISLMHVKCFFYRL
jgi:hypothetical protein